MDGEELKAARLQLGLSQAELGRALDLTRVYIGVMERGKAPVDRRTDLAVRYLLANPQALTELQALTAPPA